MCVCFIFLFPVVRTKFVGPKLPKTKTQNVRVWEGLLIEKALMDKMGALVLPQIHLKEGQSSGFFYVK